MRRVVNPDYSTIEDTVRPVAELGSLLVQNLSARLTSNSTRGMHPPNRKQWLPVTAPQSAGGAA